jgi:hypothetical protein
MATVKRYFETKAVEIAERTGYDEDFIMCMIMDCCEDGQTMDEAIEEVGAIADEKDY